MSAAVSFNVTKSEHALIAKIADRAFALAKRSPAASSSLLDWGMDITACHANGCPLRLADLLDADDANFGHDVFGIRRFLDRDTGKLGGFFLPRFSRHE